MKRILIAAMLGFLLFPLAGCLTNSTGTTITSVEVNGPREKLAYAWTGFNSAISSIKELRASGIISKETLVNKVDPVVVEVHLALKQADAAVRDGNLNMNELVSFATIELGRLTVQLVKYQRGE